MKKLVILGAGGYGRTVADMVHQLGTYAFLGFLDDTKSGENILGVCSDYRRLGASDIFMYPAFGNNEIRMEWMDRLREAGIAVPSFIHPRAYMSPEAVVGEGCVVLPLAVVSTGSVLGRGCLINLGAIVDHDCVLGSGVQLCPGAIVKAENRIPPMTRLESGTIVMARQIPL